MQFLRTLFSAWILIFPAIACAEGKIVLQVKLKPSGFLRAVSEGLKGDLIKKGDTVVSKKLTVAVDSFDTGIPLRSENFKKYLDSEKHPDVIVSDLNGSAGKAKADLEINGIKKPVEIDYEE